MSGLYYIFSWITNTNKSTVSLTICLNYYERSLRDIWSVSTWNESPNKKFAQTVASTLLTPKGILILSGIC
jgi:hypothetical protein